MVDGKLELFSIDPLSDAVQWKEANLKAYDQMVEWARLDLRKGYRPSTKLYIELLRRPHFAAQLGFVVQRMDKQVKIKNALSSGLARLIEREYPDITFPKAKATVDGW